MAEAAAQLTLSDFAEAHGRRLAAMCVAMTGNQHDGWDLAQSTLERLASAWRKGGAPREPWAYATRIAANLNVDRLRKTSREIVSDSLDLPPVQIHLADPLESWLLDGLRSLTSGQRTALALRYLENMTIAEIAESMACREGTVRSHLSRGTQRLREFAKGREGTAGNGRD